MKFPKKPFPVARSCTVTRANIAKFRELWAEHHDKAPTPEQFLDYAIPGQVARRYESRHVERAYKLMADNIVKAQAMEA